MNLQATESCELFSPNGQCLHILISALRETSSEAHGLSFWAFQMSGRQQVPNTISAQDTALFG